MKRFLFRFTFIIGILFLLVSCVAKEKVLYMQQSSSATAASFEPVLQPDDVLMIVVASENPEVVAPYNLSVISLQGDSEELAFQRRQHA